MQVLYIWIYKQQSDWSFEVQIAKVNRDSCMDKQDKVHLSYIEVTGFLVWGLMHLGTLISCTYELPYSGKLLARFLIWRFGKFGIDRQLNLMHARLWW